MAPNQKSNKQRQSHKNGKQSQLSTSVIVAFIVLVLALVAVIVAAVAMLDDGSADSYSRVSNTPSYLETSYGEFKETCAYAEIEMMDGGRIVLELYPDVAPITVANFVKLAKEGFYDGIIFHRVVEGFVIQGGDPTGTGMDGSKEKIFGEFDSNGFENNLSHKRGVISMARSDKPDSASSQFFICHQDCSTLDGNYAAFGTVISGMDVVDYIAVQPTDPDDKPYTDIVIKTVRILQDIPEVKDESSDSDAEQSAVESVPSVESTVSSTDEDNAESEEDETTSS